jgi:hypothetical protein
MVITSIIAGAMVLLIAATVLLRWRFGDLLKKVEVPFGVGGLSLGSSIPIPINVVVVPL